MVLFDMMLWFVWVGIVLFVSVIVMWLCCGVMVKFCEKNWVMVLGVNRLFCGLGMVWIIVLL